MSDDTNRLAMIEAAKLEYSNSIISSKKIGSERYEYTKNKKSQADGSTANVVVIKDKGNGTQFTIGVNVSACVKRDKQTFTTDDRLDQLQAVISAFLESIHEEL